MKQRKDQIIHPKAIELYKSKFTDFEDFLEFHDKGSKQIFIDVPVEKFSASSTAGLLEQEAHLGDWKNPEKFWKI